MASSSDRFERYLHVGGVFAMGFDPRGEYLLVVSHAGRGVFSARTWERVARDKGVVYPEGGRCLGIGPIDGVSVLVTEMNYDTEELVLASPDGSLELEYDSGTITIRCDHPF